MNWIGLVLLLLASYGIVYIYYQAIKFGYKMRTEKKLNTKKLRENLLSLLIILMLYVEVCRRDIIGLKRSIKDV